MMMMRQEADNIDSRCFWSYYNKERRLHRTKMDQEEKRVYQAAYCSRC